MSNLSVKNVQKIEVFYLAQYLTERLDTSEFHDSMIFFTIQIDKKEPSFSAVAELDLLISITMVFLSEKGEKLFSILHEQNTHIYTYTYTLLVTYAYFSLPALLLTISNLNTTLAS